MRSDSFKTLGMFVILVIVLGPAGNGLAEPAPTVLPESARQIPVAAEADVVVVGGSTGAVAAAIAAAKQGVRVFLAAPRHYLGEDMAGTLQLWLEAGETARSPLARSLFAQTEPPITGLLLSYKADRPSVGKHKDTSPPSLLSDGRWKDPVHESVQYDDDVTIRIDLGRSQPLKSVRGVVFRGSDYGVQNMSVALCEESLKWRGVGQVQCDASAPSPIILTLPLSDSARYLKCTFKKAAGARRILLGEIIVDSALPPKEPEEIRTTTPWRSNEPWIRLSPMRAWNSFTDAMRPICCKTGKGVRRAWFWPIARVARPYWQRWSSTLRPRPFWPASPVPNFRGRRKASWPCAMSSWRKKLGRYRPGSLCGSSICRSTAARTRAAKGQRLHQRRGLV